MKRFFILLASMAIYLIFPSCEQEKPQPQLVEPEPEKIEAPALVLKNHSKSSFTVSWSPVENAAGYSYMVNDGLQFSISDTILTVKNLEEGSYVLKVKSVSLSSDRADSEFAEINIDLNHQTSDIVAKWLGKWTATFNQTLSWTDAGSEKESLSVLDEEFKAELNIVENPEVENGVLISGWYPVKPDEAVHAIVLLNGSMVLQNGIVVDKSSEKGALTWMALCSAGGDFGFLPGKDLEPYVFEFQSEEAFGKIASGYLSNSLPFKLVNFGLYYDKGNGSVHIPSFNGGNYKLPAGPCKMVRK